MGKELLRKQLVSIQRLTQEQVCEIGSLLLSYNVDALKGVIKDPASSSLRVWMASASLKGIKDGDMVKMNQLLDRIVGRVSDRIEITTGENPIKVRVETMTREERLAEIDRLREIREKAGDD